MKAIKQIIDYLRERDVLTIDQLKGLAAHGFVPWEEIFGEPEAEEPRKPAPYIPIAHDDEEAEVPRVRRRGAGGKKRAVVHKGPVLQTDELCARLAGQAEAWEPRLEPLLRLARRLGPCENWEEAAVVLRNADPDAFCAAVCRSISTADPSLELLWEALGLEDYRGVLELGAHGPAVAAYRALLAIDDPGHLGKHAWLLKHEIIQRVVNVRSAQRRTLRACAFSFHDCRETFAAAIRRDRRGQAYWALVLLYSARRGAPGHRPPPTEEEGWPMRKEPARGHWGRAWAQAIAMDPDRCSPFFVEHSTRLASQPKAVCQALAGAVGALPVDLSRLIELVDQFGTAPADTAPEGSGVLVDALARLRQCVDTQTDLVLPLDGEATRAWETFLDQWLRQYQKLGSPQFSPSVASEMEDLVADAFGARAALLCPKTWAAKSW